ncbi:MAG TPA: hypothetical protein VH253_20525 [Phycisphaerae bacterium]|nr:hypothetical protein [Phycisphaerae bacterium]
MSQPPADPQPPAPVTPAQPPAPPSFPLIARASAGVRNKNILIILMCLAFFGWFTYDAFVRYPQQDDQLVAYMKGISPSNNSVAIYDSELNAWKGWSAESSEARAKMTDIASIAKVDGWHSASDIATQKVIVAGLALAVLAALWWFFHCQARRAIAQPDSVSPAPGITIPWTSITVVDNSRWKSTGIVDITYTDPSNAVRQAKFDDYELEREPLLAILDQLAERAVNAEFLPKAEPIDDSIGETSEA